MKLIKPAAALGALTALFSPGLAWAQAAAAPVAATVDKGDTAWMMTATILVLMMIVPGLALFYGGLTRTKNMLSVMTQIGAVACLAMLVWVMWGYTMAFGPDYEGPLSNVIVDLRQGVPGGRHARVAGGDLHRRRRDPRVCLHLLPDDLRGDHDRAGAGIGRGADQVHAR